MCYYVTINIAKKDSIKVNNKTVQIKDATLVKPLQNGFNYAPFPIIKNENDNLVATDAHWEFIASWSKDWNAIKENRKKYTTLNAKGETLLTSKLYQQAALQTRCLIPVTGFFEWRTIQLPHLTKPSKVPYFIYVPNQPYFYLAGIYNSWLDKATGELIDTFAIVTTAANSLMEQIHNSQKRMPTILTDQLAEQWLGTIDQTLIQQIATHQYDAQAMEAYSIDTNFRTLPIPTTKVQYDAVPDLIL
jgi:putative SOS response-associated peptidase YedK